ncbi:uncharacterized protein YjbI with pentapeptide repeats [Prescottella equi]
MDDVRRVVEEVVSQSDGGLTQAWATVIASLGVLGSGLLVWRSNKKARELASVHFHETHELAVTRGLRERFTTIAGQIADPSPAVRIAGVYAMGALADDWIKRRSMSEAQACVNILCAYLRAPYSVDAIRGDNEVKRVVSTTLRNRVVEEHLEFRQDDLEVRRCIVQTIAKRLLVDSIDSWSNLNFDFRSAYFVDADLTEAVFGRDVSFAGATFDGEMARFDHVRFGGNADFTRACFRGKRISFAGAAFAGRCEFVEARSDQQVAVMSFEGASFEGWITNFTDAVFEGRRLEFTSATFSSQETLFIRTQFRAEEISFESAKLFGGTTRFGKAEFHGSTTFMDHVTFAPEKQLTFSSVKFLSSDGTFFSQSEFRSKHTSFGEAEFRSEVTEFEGVLFGSGVVKFPKARFGGREVIFHGAAFIGGRISFFAATFEDQTIVTFDYPAMWNNVTFDWSARVPNEMSARKPGNVLPVKWPPELQKDPKVDDISAVPVPFERSTAGLAASKETYRITETASAEPEPDDSTPSSNASAGWQSRIPAGGWWRDFVTRLRS